MYKRGFTLAEILVTIGIIGVVAAMTLPTLLGDGAKQQLGAKLAGFTSRLENIAKQYADDVDLTQVDDLLSVLNAELLFTDSGDLGQNNEKTLRDGTSIEVNNSTPTEYSGATSNAGTLPNGIIVFRPNINGLDGKTFFQFYITKNGEVYPEGSDSCAIALYEANYKATKAYKTGSNDACYANPSHSTD